VGEKYPADLIIFSSTGMNGNPFKSKKKDEYSTATLRLIFLNSA
jgi:hypothetical protein